MNRIWYRAIVTTALATSLLASGGTASSYAATNGRHRPKTTEASRCPRDPYPCGGEWPAELVGRDDFPLDRIDEVRVRTRDGIALDGWIAFPQVPVGVKRPTVLSSSPYFDSVLPVPGAVYRDPTSQVAVPAGGAQGWFDDTVPLPLDVNTHSAGFPPVLLLRKG